MEQKHRITNFLITTLLFSSLILMLVYTMGYFNFAPYIGIIIRNGSGDVEYVFDPQQQDKILTSDQVLSIGSIPINPENEEKVWDLWKSLSPGETAEIKLLRDGETITVDWVVPGRTNEEETARRVSQWFLPYIFYVVGLIVFTSVRPKDRLWRLLFTFSITTALWLVVGSGPSRFFLWKADDLLAVFTWFFIATILELHWVFPKPFNNIPPWVNRMFVILIYAGAVGMSIYEILYPHLNLFTNGFSISIVICMALLIVHAATQKEARAQISIVLRMTAAAFVPFIMIIAAELLNSPISAVTQAGALLGLPLLPMGYLVAIWRGNLSTTKFRANQFISIYIYLMVLFSLIIPTLGFITDQNGMINNLYVLLLMLALSLLILLTYTPFKRLVERYVLRIPIPLPQLLETYATSLSNTQNANSISSIMRNMILPSLLIRQSLLVEFQSSTHLRVIDARGIENRKPPTAGEINQLLAHQQPILTKDHRDTLPVHLAWVNVVIPLNFDGDLIGAWLLGRRDPDDIYDHELMRIIQAIAQQTAIAIINHQRSTRLRILYEANINRSEAERASLARDLHDDTLNELALLQRKFPDEELSTSLAEITNSLRKVIHGLRPTVLSYGLETALYDLADTLNEINNDKIVSVELECAPNTLHPETELHVFRIVQQACENAVQHAEASSIKITGIINNNLVKIIVKDDGKGIEGDMVLDLLALVEANHFGMAGMHERAALIKASLDIESPPEGGTKVILELPGKIFPR